MRCRVVQYGRNFRGIAGCTERRENVNDPRVSSPAGARTGDIVGIGDMLAPAKSGVSSEIDWSV